MPGRRTRKDRKKQTRTKMLPVIKGMVMAKDAVIPPRIGPKIIPTL